VSLVLDRRHQLRVKNRIERVRNKAKHRHAGGPGLMAERRKKQAVLIAGPTASGKSAFALERARAIGGVVVNADAMQVYDVLSVLTARPAPEDVAQAPHHLFGFVAPSVRFSTGQWLREVEALLPRLEDCPLVFAGGTGLYFDALTRGFAEVPEVPRQVVEEVQAELKGLDRAGRAKLIAERDPETARVLRVPDPQRVARALAVLRATGRPLASFQQRKQRGVLEGYALERIVLDPAVAVLRERISRRFAAMFESGAVEEVKALLALRLDPSLPAMKAIGVREIAGWLNGRLSREQAIEQAVVATRQYAKRQRTWFRNRMADWIWMGSPQSSGDLDPNGAGRAFEVGSSDLEDGAGVARGRPNGGERE
jgi:tRNA dimethylallyltransferase